VHADEPGYAPDCKQRPIDVWSSAAPRVVSHAESLIGHPENDFGTNDEAGEPNGVDLCPCQRRAAGSPLACCLLDRNSEFRGAHPRQPRRELTSRTARCVDLVIVRVVDARLWYRFDEDYRALRNTKPPVGQALTDDEQQRLFAAAQSRPDWIFAYVATALSFYCGLRACEIKGLQWKHVDFDHAKIQIRRSKTPAGWRDPSLNDACLRGLRELWTRADELSFTKPDHYLFAWQGRAHEIDPTRPMEAWRSAWRSLRHAAGLDHVRFHDGRHTALTRLCEAGQPDWVIQAQMGHVSPAMMKTYSHIRRKALDEAAKSLEPALTLEFPKHEERPRVKGRFAPYAPADSAHVTVTAQSDDLDRESREFSKEFGSSGWIRTSNPPVNSRMLYR
jgi:integrase